MYHAAKDSILNHLWYLCPELVVLAFFDQEVPNPEKTAMARSLLQHPMPADFAPGKPGGRHFEQVMYTIDVVKSYSMG